MISMARMTRDKAPISFLAQSGQRSGLVRSLRHGQVRDQLERKVNPVVIDVQEGFEDFLADLPVESQGRQSLSLGRLV